MIFFYSCKEEVEEVDFKIEYFFISILTFFEMILTYKNNFQIFFLSIIISIFINTRKIIFQIKYLYELNTRFFIFVIEIYIFYFL